MARKVFLALVLLGALIMDLRFMDFGQKATWPIDFQVFWLAARAPLDTIYSAREMPFAYPPTSFWLFKPLGLLPFRFAGGRIAALSFLSPAAFSGILLGQSSMLLGGLTYLAFQLPALAGGAALGLVATVKPQLVLLAPLALLVRRDWPMLGGMAAGALVPAIIVTLFQPSLWQEWLNAVAALNEALIATNAASVVVTPAGRTEYYELPQLPFLMLGLAVGGAAVILGARRMEREYLVALITAASLAGSPYAHVHDTIALIPACLLLVIRGQWWAAVPAGLIVVGQPDLVAISMLAGLAMVATTSRVRGPGAATPICP